MNQYIAFLRGINISGKNKVSMTELKAEFEKTGFAEVSTYLNSGNIVFSSETDNTRAVIEKMLSDKFELEAPAYVIKMDELKDILLHSPKWWDSGNKEKYDNLIFILSGDNPEKVCDLVGDPSQGIEMIEIYKNVIFETYHSNGKYDKESGEVIMASSKEYLDFVLEQLSDLEGVTYRAMMGEYILYYQGKIIGGIYDDRFLVKPVKAVVKLMPKATSEIPYEGAKEMLLVDDIDNREFLVKLINDMYDELPAPKKKK